MSSTLNALNTLLGIVNARNKNTKNYKPGSSTVTPSAPNQPGDSSNSPATNSTNPSDPLNPVNNPSTSPTTPQANSPPQPQPAQPATQQSTNPGPNAENQLRQQLQQADPYDLNGEKAAAEAMKRDDAFKQQQIQQKAEETKQFFAEQDRKQEQAHQEIQKQADQQLQEQAQKEFWNQKQQQEMQAGMGKELERLHQAGKQAHQEWRNDFTEGICRDDAAALYNKDIRDRTMAYKERLDDLGTNPVQANETIAKYQVKLQDEAAPQIEQKAGELHQEHFPEYANGPHVDAHGPETHGPEAHGPEHPPEAEHPEAESTEKPGKTGPGITYPQGGPQYNMPGLGGRESIRPAPEVSQQAQGGNGSGGGDSPPPSEPPARATDPQTMFEDTWQARAKFQDQNDPDLRFEKEHPAQDKVIKSGLAALDEASGQSVLNKHEAQAPLEPNAVDVDHAGDGLKPEDPKRIYGEGEKELEENEKIYGPKGAQNAQTLGKMSDAYWDVTSETIDMIREKGKAPWESAQGKTSQEIKHESNHPTDVPHNLTDLTGALTITAVGIGAIVKNKYGDSLKVSSGEELDKLAQETKSSLDTDQNKVWAEAKYNDAHGIRPPEQQPAPPDTQAPQASGVKGPAENPEPVVTSMQFPGSATFGMLAGQGTQDLNIEMKGPGTAASPLNPNLANEYAKILQQRGDSAAQVDAGVNKINEQIQKVEQENKPPAPAPAPNVAPQPGQPQPQQQNPAPSLSQSFNSVA